MIIGKAITAGGSGNLVVKILPEGYGQLDYIESTGTQWIDLGLPLNQDCKLEMKISHFDTVGNRKTFGSRASATSNNFSVVSGPVGGTMSIVTDFYNYNNNRLAYIINGEETLEIFISKEKLKINDTEKAVTTYGDFETPGNAYLFSCSGTYPAGYSSASMRLYYCKIYDNDVLVRNLIPCVNSSEEVGLYDIVNGIFYRNNGTGTFIAGKRTDAVNSNNIVCKLLVNTGAGAVVTATLDGSTASATANENGNVVFYLPKEGLWTVSATLDGETKSTEILVEHNVEESLTFFPQEPSAYNQLALITASQIWTAPEDGWFQIEVFGASGNGGVGTGYSNSPRGGGGGGGGYSASRISLNKGDTIVLTVGAVGSTTKAIIDSSHNNSYDHTLQVTSGANGTSGSSLTGAGPGGAGGTASGGNYTNKNGGNGADGGTGGAGGTAGYTGGNVGGAGTTSKTANPGSAGFIKIYRGNTN